MYGGHYQPVIHAWSPQTSQSLPSLPSEGGVEVLALSPDGRWLISAGRDLRIWSMDWPVQTWPPALKFELISPDDSYLFLQTSISPTNEHFAISDSQGKVFVRSFTQPAEIRCTLETKFLSIKGLAHLNEYTLLVGGDNSGVSFWDLNTCKQSEDRLHIVGSIQDLALSADREWLAVLASGQVQVWDLKRRTLVETLQTDRSGIASTAFSPQGRTLTTIGSGPWAQLWQWRNTQPDQPIGQHAHPIHALSLSPTGQTLLSIDNGGHLNLWHTPTRQPLPTVPLPAGESAIGAHISDDTGQKTWIITSKEDRWILRDALGNEKASLGSPSSLGIIRNSTLWNFSADGRRLAILNAHGTISVWRLDLPQVLQEPTLLGPLQVPDSLAFSPNSRFLAAADALGRLAVWDLDTQTLLWSHGAHTEAIMALAFSPDGQQLASASRDSNIILWDRSSGRRLHTLSKHTGWVWTLAFSPDGLQLLSSGKDNALMLWSSATGERLRTIPTTQPIRAAQFDHKGAYLILAEGSRIQQISLSANIWNQPPEQVLSQTEMETGLLFRDFEMRLAVDALPSRPSASEPSGFNSGRVMEIIGTSQRKPASGVDAEVLNSDTLQPLNPPVVARSGQDGELTFNIPNTTEHFALRLSKDGQSIYYVSPWLKRDNPGWELDWISNALQMLMLFETGGRPRGSVTALVIAMHGPFLHFGDAAPSGCLQASIDDPTARIFYADQAVRPRQNTTQTHPGSGLFTITNISPNQPHSIKLSPGTETFYLPALPPNSTILMHISAPASNCR